MSRYIIDNPVGWPADYQLAVGWDEGLQTYFAQVIDRQTDRCLVWVGTVEVISSIEELQNLANDGLPEGLTAIRIGKGTVRRLESDRNHKGGDD